VAETPEEIRARWQQVAQQGIPPESKALARNAGITARYARLYVENPHIFKWAGMAAFASHRVGLALLPYQFEEIEGVLRIMDHHAHPLGQEILSRDLNLIRETNNNVFQDIAWTHLAYLSPDGGLAAIEGGLMSSPEHWRLGQGFQLIHGGQKLLKAGDSSRANQMIWQGNRFLLQHEQFVTVQPAFERLSKLFAMFLSFATALTFEASNFSIDEKWFTSFAFYMWTRGLHVLIRTRSFPDIALREHRWFWCDHSVLSTWKRVDRSDLQLQANMAVLMKGGATSAYLSA
jgi:hypothetical protein